MRRNSVVREGRLWFGVLPEFGLVVVAAVASNSE
jgi:hypothetical protein